MSAHFSLPELCASDYATRHGISNRPPDDVAVANLGRLMDRLELIRSALGDRPVIVTSGYRSPAVNKAVGGSHMSAHMDGRAADIKVVGLAPRAVATILRDSGIPLDQLILEFGLWVHVGIERESFAPRKDVLTARSGVQGVGYVQGIV